MTSNIPMGDRFKFTRAVPKAVDHPRAGQEDIEDRSHSDNHKDRGANNDGIIKGTLNFIPAQSSAGNSQSQRAKGPETGGLRGGRQAEIDRSDDDKEQE